MRVAERGNYMPVRYLKRPVRSCRRLSVSRRGCKEHIVWAIQPHRDHLSDLKQRMRRFAADVLSARNVEMHWSVGDSDRDFELNTELRRQVYLIFKESINNVARHSRATEARIALQIVERQLALEVSDNGC